MALSRSESLQSLVERIHVIVKSMHKTHGFQIGKHKLTRPHVGILFLIVRKNGKVSVKELAEHFNITSGAITQLIDNLVDKKLVKREEDGLDRRMLNISLTAKAEKEFKEF